MVVADVTIEHASVLLIQTLELLAVEPAGAYVDCTLGGGGHAAAILAALGPQGRLLGLDRDQDAIDRVADRLGADPRVRLFHENYKNLPLILAQLEIGRINGCLIDLGVSTQQLLTAGRGFSFQNDGPLDMRMDRRQVTTAADLVNTLSADELAGLFRRYGEEKQARRVARAIVERRREADFRRTAELAAVIEQVMGKARPGRIHPATRVFQALRIEVNQELAGLGDFLSSVIDRLAVGGRLVVLAFHSLEDRIVKQTLRREAGRCVCFRPPQMCDCPRVSRVEVLTRRPITPTDQEIENNRRARSARLRAARRLPVEEQ